MANMAGEPCPYPPCQAVTAVTLYLRNPGDMVPTLPMIDPHDIVHAGRTTSEPCPAGLMRLPLSEHAVRLLGARYEVWRKRRPVVSTRPDPHASPAIPEHSLTPHPTESSQWFGGRSFSQEGGGMASAAEVKAQIGAANLELASAVELTRQAAERFAEAKAILGGVRQETQQELGLTLAGEALSAAKDATTYGVAAIELNSAYERTL